LFDERGARTGRGLNTETQSRHRGTQRRFYCRGAEKAERQRKKLNAKGQRCKGAKQGSVLPVLQGITGEDY
jgi:hypothetical protein